MYMFDNWLDIGTLALGALIAGTPMLLKLLLGGNRDNDDNKISRDAREKTRVAKRICPGLKLDKNGKVVP